MIIRPYIPKRKPRKPNAKQRELSLQWEAILKKYKTTKKITAKMPQISKPYIRETEKYPSLPFTGDPCIRPIDKIYTGNAIIGIATLHKSNAVPVFSVKEAKEIARMRRG